jgi:hypothetical protein
MEDPFFRFWFHVVAPRRAVLASAPSSVRLALWAQQKERITAEAWENLCRTAAPGVPEVLGEGGDVPWLPARRWWHGNEPEWDVISCTADGSASLVGEVKWSVKPVTEADLEKMAQDLLVRPLPPNLPPQMCRVLFVPRSASRKSITRNGVRIVEAETVLKILH